LLICDPVGFVAQLLQVVHERFEAPRIAADRVQDTPRAGVEGTGVLGSRAAISLCPTKYRPPLLATRHLVAPSPARPATAAAVAAPSRTATTLLEAV
jgi:hypothetical protein